MLGITHMKNLETYPEGNTGLWQVLGRREDVASRAQMVEQTSEESLFSFIRRERESMVWS